MSAIRGYSMYCFIIIVWTNSLINSLESADKVVQITSWTKSIHFALPSCLNVLARGHETHSLTGVGVLMGRLYYDTVLRPGQYRRPSRNKDFALCWAFLQASRSHWLSVSLSSFLLRLCQTEWRGTLCLYWGWRALWNLHKGQIQDNLLLWNRKCWYSFPLGASETNQTCQVQTGSRSLKKTVTTDFVLLTQFY